MKVHRTSKSTMLALALVLSNKATDAFAPRTPSIHPETSRLFSAPKRLEENVEGVLYVNDRCINCAACANFAPAVFGRTSDDRHHFVHHQPSSESLDTARAALAACPVGAIRVENQAQRSHKNLPSLSEEERDMANSLAISPKLNGLEKPFPRLFADNVYYTGHHNDASFGATPFLSTGMYENRQIWVMVDTPKFSKASVATVTSLTGPQGPDYLFITHVDDAADHQKWAAEFPSLRRIFHAGDLGRFNWVGDRSLEDVEVLLRGQADTGLLKYTLDGNLIKDGDKNNDDFVIWHTPGHSPGSISLLRKGPQGVLFTGDTYAYSTRNGGGMSGFPRYNSGGRDLQANTLQEMVKLSDQWDVIAAGHGHPRDYRGCANKQELKQKDMLHAVEELSGYAVRF